MYLSTPALLLALLLNCAVLVICKSYYSVIAPGVIKSNRKYAVAVSLHEADEPAVINVRVQGPFYYSAQNVLLQPHETKSISFVLTKLVEGEHRLIAEGVSGIKFRNESKISAYVGTGPKIYIQTDRAVYKPGDVVQFRCLVLDEHTRPLYAKEPIRVEIMDAANNRIKQFKDIRLDRGVFKGSYQLSEHPIEGTWNIKVVISGRYDYSGNKGFKVGKLVFPKFSVHIEANNNIFPKDGAIKAKIYGKYTFGKYVEGLLTVNVTSYYVDNFLETKRAVVNTTVNLEIPINVTKAGLPPHTNIVVIAQLEDKYTGNTESARKNIEIQINEYKIYVLPSSIEYKSLKPYQLTAHVRPLDESIALDLKAPLIVRHGSKEYQAYLDAQGDATFEFEHEPTAKHIFYYKDSSYTLPNIQAYANVRKPAKKKSVERVRQDEPSDDGPKLRLKGNGPQLGAKLEIEVNSTAYIPYINYVLVGHATIIKVDRIEVPPNSKSFTFAITPSIEMIPTSFIYVYYVQNNQLRYEEMEFTFPREFENRVSVIAPEKVGPGQNVTIELKAQPGSLVGLMAVDLAVYHYDPSYDLKGDRILEDLNTDRTYLPFLTFVYPGRLSGVITLTNAHYLFVPMPRVIEPKSAGPAKKTIRTKFPETWIFENYNITNESTILKLTIPDTITIWRLTAFTVNDVTGFGIVDWSTDIKTIQTFFIVLKLPYAVKRGEIVPIPVLVYNYHNQSVEAEITMFNQENEFYFLEPSVLGTETGSEEQQKVERVTVPANRIARVEFLINPRRVGKINLQVTAENPLSRDGVIRQLKVEPEGVVKRESKSIFAKLSENNLFSHSFDVDMPADIVPDSQFITLTVGGDSLVPTLENLNSLVLLPTGCGEQNMINFVPNILVLDYLKASGNTYKQRPLLQKARKFIDLGFQQQMSYRHSNGGYSVFGENKDKETSTWLTAYVIRFFIKASSYLSIEPHIITSGLDFLAGKQFEGGDFPYTGYLFYPAQQNRYGFTAFVLMTFLENQKFAQKYQSTIQRGLTFINTNLDRINDVYALAITATALQLAQHENAKKVIEKLKMLRKEKDQEIWWSQDDQNREKDVEITAYVLMALVQSDNDPSENLKILKWLVAQRNPKGGFKSTQDTAVGLQALVKFSQKYGNPRDMNMKIKHTAKNQEKEALATGDLSMDASNMLILQSQELPLPTRLVDINVTGSGYCLIQLSYEYNVAADGGPKHFHIQAKPQWVGENVVLEICLEYMVADANASSSSSNMIIMETNLPSGFTTTDDSTTDLLESELVQRVETKNGDTTVVIYFGKLAPNEHHCLRVFATKVRAVLQRKPSAIYMYDYYNISRHDTVFYNV